MKRYYFDMRDGDEVIPDEEGMELATMKAVQREAALALVDLTRDEIGLGQSDGPGRLMAIDVRYDNGPVLAVTFQFTFDRARH